MHQNIRFFSTAALCLCSLAANADVKTFNGERNAGESIVVAESPEITFATWVKIDGWGKGDKPYPRIIDGPAFYFHPTQGSDGLAGLTLGVRLPDGVSSWNFPALLPEKQWTHVAVTMGGVSPYDSGLPRIFINGKDADVRPADKPMPAVFAGGTAWLGNSRKDGDRPFEGCLGNVTYETRRMSDEEIADMAQVSPDGTRPKEIVKPCHDELPIVDISREKFRQTVIAMGTPDVYQGHPTTVLTKDGKTIFCVWTFQHGGPCGPMARSDDGGKTWKRLDSILPPAYAATHRNCPTLQAVNTPDGAERRFCIFSAKKGGMGILMSRDEGESWYEVPPAKLSAGMPPTGFIQLKDGTSALFGQIRTNPAVKTDGPTDDQDVWMSITKDGGFTWSPAKIVAHKEQKNLCEPFALRSPDGDEICLLIRENRHTARSMMCFSRDEGQTWTAPEDTCWGLSGDRHEGIQLPDGRWLIAFRDRALGSSTYGQYVAWVGTYDDIRNGRPGQYRIHLLHHCGRGGWPACDTGYSGVELLPDGTIICTTYTKHWDDERLHSVVCTRFNMAEIDEKFAKLQEKK